MIHIHKKREKFDDHLREPGICCHLMVEYYDYLNLVTIPIASVLFMVGWLQSYHVIIATSIGNEIIVENVTLSHLLLIRVATNDLFCASNNTNYRFIANQMCN